MLRALAGAGVPAPMVEGEHDGVLLLEHVAERRRVQRQRLGRYRRARCAGCTTDAASTMAGRSIIGSARSRSTIARRATGRLSGASSGWSPTAAMLDRPWRERVERLAPRLADLLPAAPPPAFLHGDLWTGNILVAEGRLAALIDPACYHGDAEVDLAMLTLFDAPPDAFWEAYGALEPGWEERRPLYQLFPALVHIRLHGPTWEAMTDRLLRQIGGLTASRCFVI